MTENDNNPLINNDPTEKKKRIYRSPLVSAKHSEIYGYTSHVWEKRTIR